MAAGFKLYRSFFVAPPAVVVEWHDDRTRACGWLCIDSLRGGAAGGGTRMRDAGSREEAVFLAKTMGVKFRVCGPSIGGGKSVIRFDPHAHPDQKLGVLERWFAHVGPYLRECYGTGGDVNVDEVSEATAITSRVLGIGHPQEGICRGHMSRVDGEAVSAKVARLKHGCEATLRLADLPGPRDGSWMVADAVTGLGVARSIERYAERRGVELDGKRLIVEGLGAVGAFAAYYLEKRGVRLVAASTRGGDGIRVARCATGMDARALIGAREGTHLPRALPRSLPGASVVRSPSGDELFGVEADIFVPAAASHTITPKRLKQLAACGVSLWSCGANNPFAYASRSASLASWVDDMIAIGAQADKQFAIIPDFVANCGMARTFAYLMGRGGSARAADIMADTERAIDDAVDRLIDGYAKDRGLLAHGYEVFLGGGEAGRTGVKGPPSRGARAAKRAVSV